MHYADYMGRGDLSKVPQWAELVPLSGLAGTSLTKGTGVHLSIFPIFRTAHLTRFDSFEEKCQERKNFLF